MKYKNHRIWMRYSDTLHRRQITGIISMNIGKLTIPFYFLSSVNCLVYDRKRWEIRDFFLFLTNNNAKSFFSHHIAGWDERSGVLRNERVYILANRAHYRCIEWLRKQKSKLQKLLFAFRICHKLIIFFLFSFFSYQFSQFALKEQ